jgi:isoleucyl-tRNA synthetase
MPYAQFHYPFENKDNLKDYFPADFIAEGVDQTRGWFFTLHAISSMIFDSVSYKTVVSNGLVLDKFGVKMSKRLGNAIDPFSTIQKYGADATRWYMITNAQPWDNLKFDLEGVAEVQRKFFGTLYNTYAFFALYANIDGFKYKEEEIPLNERPEIDRWILSLLNSLISEVDASYNEYEPTRAGRMIQDFVNEHLSNWYVRLSRRRFWKGDYSTDKISAYQTLYRCLETIAMLAAPIAPFFMERLYRDLNSVSERISAESIHLANLPVADEKYIDKDLEDRMALAQTLSSMVLSLRKKVNIRVRQPLNRIMIPMPDESVKTKIDNVTSLILSEVNVKNLEYIHDTEGVLVKKIKPDFKALGPKFGKKMKAIAAVISTFGQPEILSLERKGSCMITVENEEVALSLEDVEILSEDIPGWQVAVQGTLTVALDITLTDDLKEEGIARELINRIQNMRKDKGFDVTDKISVQIKNHEKIIAAVNKNLNYICTETLATSLSLVEQMDNPTEAVEVEVDETIKTTITIIKN